MSLVQEPIDLASAPSNHEDHLGIEDREEAADTSDRQTVQVTPFDQRDRALTQSGTYSDIRLPQSKALTKRPRETTDDDVLHGGSR